MGRQLFQLAALIVITFAAYFPTLHNGFIWDDDRYVEENTYLHTLHGLEKIWFKPLSSEPQYYPLTHTTLWVEYHLWGLKPLGYHLDNVLLQAASAALLWRILRRLKIGGAWVAAAIFAVHPVQVETVAWATERKNVLSGFFYFLSLTAYLRTRWGRWIWDENQSDAESAGAGWYAASIILFIAAILSKSVASTLPEVILLLCWWKRGTIRRSDVWPVLPMVVAGLAMGSLTGWMEKHIVGARGPFFDHLTALDRCCIAGRAFWFYLVKLAWPVGLSFMYSPWHVDPMQRPWWVLFFLSAVAALLALWLLRRRISRGPATAAFFFAGTLLPALGFVNVFPMQYSDVADHFQYLACIGPIALAVEVLRRMRIGAVRPILAVAVIACLCVASNVRARVYYDRLTLWADTVAKSPLSPVSHNNYAGALRSANQLDAAKAQYLEALRLGNDSINWVGMGQCYAMANDYVTALQCYQKALAGTSNSPDEYSHQFRSGREFQVGTAYQGLAAEFPEKSAEYLSLAEATYRQAIADYPEYEDANDNLAIVLCDEKRYPEAIAQCNRCIELYPDSIDGYTNLGMVNFQAGQLDQALTAYQEVLKIDPENSQAMASIGGILAQMGKLDEAIEILRETLRVDPDNKLAQEDLAAILLKRAEKQQ
jgi:protein O-mannosyl-transferase